MSDNSPSYGKFGVCVDELRAAVRRFKLFGYTRGSIQSALADVRQKYPEMYESAFVALQLELMNERRELYHSENSMVERIIGDNEKLMDAGVDLTPQPITEKTLRGED